MKLKLISLFTTVGLGLILLIPLVSASDTIYFEENFDNETNGILNDDPDFVYAKDVALNPTFALKEARTTSGTNYEYAAVNLPSTGYEVKFDFLIHGITTTEYTLFGVTNAPNGITCSGEISVQLISGNPILLVNNVNTGYVVTNDTWHTIWFNVTGYQYMDWQYDSNDIVYDAPTQVSGYHTYINLGKLSSITHRAWAMWDNMIIGTRTGEIPTADFTVSPDTGDGLTLFTFTDNSNLSTTPIEHSYSWDFGDGNYSTVPNPIHYYIWEGNYTVNLTVTNKLGSSYHTQLIYVNKSASMCYGGGGIILPGDGEITDDMFGFIIVILLITGMNILGTKTGYLMLNVFAILGMLVAIPLLWQNDPVYIALMMITALGNIALLAYGFTRD